MKELGSTRGSEKIYAKGWKSPEFCPQKIEVGWNPESIRYSHTLGLHLKEVI